MSNTTRASSRYDSHRQVHRDVTRLWLPPLSEVAVATLAQQTDRPVKDLYSATGGNPFFVTEVLASTAAGIPTGVRDAVLARVARLSRGAQSLLEVASVVPTKVAWWVVKAVSAAHSARLKECLAAGMLSLEEGAVAFRHELARQAVESALSPARQQALHAQVLQTLLERGAEDRGVEQASLARLVHHAAHAEDAALVLQFAPAAAKQASAQGAHREAAAHCQTALRYADRLDAAQHAELLDGLSNELYLTGHSEDAVAPCEAALAIWRAMEYQEQVGHTLRRLSRLSWYRGRKTEAERYAAEAVELLETLPPSRELAMAYGNLAHLHMLVNDTAATLFWGKRALALAEQLHDLETACYALNTIGSAEDIDGDERAWATMERSLKLALEHGYEEHVARAYANLAIHRVACRAYKQAESFLRDGVAYCAERDLDPWGHFLRWVQARARLDQGDWVGAEEDATAILSVPWASGTNRGPALIVLGYVRLRRGDPGVEGLLDEERDLALATGALERIAPMAAARGAALAARRSRGVCGRG
jgi:hypothetical protein